MAALEPPPSGVPSGGASDADPCAAVLFGYSSCGQANGSVVPQDAPVAQVSLGWEHTAVVTAERQLYVWGSNEFGQRGDGGADGDAGNGATAVGAGAARPMGTAKVVAVACGAHHTAALTPEGRVYSWGRYQRASLPKHVKLPSPVMQVACGGRHTLALLETYRVFAWGYNEYGQLGCGRTSQCMQHVPSEITPLRVLEHDGDGEDGGADAAGSAGATTDLDDVNAGGESSAAESDVTDSDMSDASEGEGDATGASTDAASGATSDRRRRRHRRRMRLRRPAFVAAGGEHSLCLDRKGSVYSWGNGAIGQLGHVDLNAKLVSADADGRTDGAVCPCPRRVAALELLPCSAVAAGHAHSVALSERGAVYVWGSNLDGQCGLGVPPCVGLGSARESAEASAAVWSPELLMQGGATRVDCGTSHTLVLKDNGDVFGCGYNGYRQVSGPTARSSPRTLWHPCRFPRDSLPPEGAVREVMCGGGHSALLVDVGDAVVLARTPRAPVAARAEATPASERSAAAAGTGAASSEGTVRAVRESIEAIDVPKDITVGSRVAVVVRAAADERDPGKLYSFMPRPAHVATLGSACEVILDDGRDLEVPLERIEAWEAYRQGVGKYAGTVVGPEERLEACMALVDAGNKAVSERGATAAAAAAYGAALSLFPQSTSSSGGNNDGDSRTLDVGALVAVRQPARRKEGTPDWRPAMVSCRYGGTPGVELTYDVLYDDDLEPDEEEDVPAARIQGIVSGQAAALDEGGGASAAAAIARERARAGRNLAKVLLDLGELAAACCAASWAVADDPESAKALYLRGRARLESGELEGALADARAAARGAPNSGEARELLARCRLALADRRASDQSLFRMVFGWANAAAGVARSAAGSAASTASMVGDLLSRKNGEGIDD